MKHRRGGVADAEDAKLRLQTTNHVSRHHAGSSFVEQKSARSVEPRHLSPSTCFSARRHGDSLQYPLGVIPLSSPRTRRPDSIPANRRRYLSIASLFLVVIAAKRQVALSLSLYECRHRGHQLFQRHTADQIFVEYVFRDPNSVAFDLRSTVGRCQILKYSSSCIILPPSLATSFYRPIRLHLAHEHLASWMVTFGSPTSADRSLTTSPVLTPL